ncbi:helix-turn-helix domain-containing protein [Streptomycetaceae bacterium NBC_01309]
MDTRARRTADSTVAPGRYDDLAAMHRLAVRRDAVRTLVQWLAERTGCWVALLNADGSVRHAAADLGAPGDAHETLREIDPVRSLAEGGRGSAVVDAGDCTGIVMPVPSRGGMLAAVGVRPLPEGVPQMLTDAAPLVGIGARMEDVERTSRQLEVAEARSREAVLHLLMSGRLSTARQIAGALQPQLPDTACVYVVECAAKQRPQVARHCAEATGGHAWIVRCPVYARHLIAVVPAHTGTTLAQAITDAVAECVVAVSDVVSLRDTATGYHQAFHVLPAARGSAERHARFSALTDLAALAGLSGAAWAAALLRPLLAYVPSRPQDPGLEELIATAHSWLSFANGATRHLRLHRNTVAARVRRIEELLHLDLTRLSDQSALSLALRIHAVPRAAAARNALDGATLDDVLALPAVRDWARLQVRVLGSDKAPSGMETLRIWLRHDARLSATAAALDISVSGARKRLTRLEEAMERSLLNAPSARYDLWLTLKALDVAGAMR